jgi:regulator of cell morphogenesis and NO signaling
MKISESTIVGEIVANNYKTSEVFNSYNIDFCCSGNRSLKIAAEKAGKNVSEIIQQLENIMESNSKTPIDYKTVSLSELINHILETHHTFVAQKSIEIVPYLEKIRNVHGEKHPELREIEMEFKQAVGELAMHMKKEELILFPYIKRLEKASKEKSIMTKPMFDSVASPIAGMKHEHAVEGDRFAKISELSNAYTTPADGCGTYQVAYKLLKEFEKDLHLHIHLENNILFEKALQLENQYRILMKGHPGIEA